MSWKLKSRNVWGLSVLTSNYSIEPLKELISFVSKGIPPKYTEIKNKETVVVLNQRTNRNFKIDYSVSRLNDLTKKSVPEKKMLITNDILINSTGVGTAGRIAQIFNVPEPTTVDGHMIIVRADKPKIDPVYLGYALKAQQLKIESLQEGSTGQTELNRQRLLDEIEIVYPKDRKKQEEISNLFLSIDNKISVNNKINHHLLEQAIAIHKEYCISLADETFVLETVKSISTDVVTGKTPSTKKKEYYGGTLPFITIPDMHGQVYCVKTARYLTNSGEQSQPKKTLPKNSIAVSCIATPGLVSMLDRESQTNQQINSVIPKSDQEYYLFLELLSKSPLIIELGSSGSTTYNLNKTQFEKIEILAPPIKRRIWINRLLKPLFLQINQRQKEIYLLSALRDTLMPKLLSGENFII